MQSTAAFCSLLLKSLWPNLDFKIVMKEEGSSTFCSAPSIVFTFVVVFDFDGVFFFFVAADDDDSAGENIGASVLDVDAIVLFSPKIGKLI